MMLDAKKDLSKLESLESKFAKTMKIIEKDFAKIKGINHQIYLHIVESQRLASIRATYDSNPEEEYLEYKRVMSINKRSMTDDNYELPRKYDSFEERNYNPPSRKKGVWKGEFNLTERSRYNPDYVRRSKRFS